MFHINKSIFVMVFLFCIAQAFATVSVTDSTFQMNVSGETYQLANAVTFASGCVNVTANNTFLDLNGYLLTFSATGSNSAYFDFGANGCTTADTVTYENFSAYNGSITGNTASNLVNGADLCGVVYFNNITFTKTSGTSHRLFLNAPNSITGCSVATNFTINKCTITATNGFIESANGAGGMYVTNNTITISRDTNFFGTSKNFVFRDNIINITGNPTNFIYFSSSGDSVNDNFYNNSIYLANITTAFIRENNRNLNDLRIQNNNFYANADLSARWISMSDTKVLNSSNIKQNYYNFTSIACGTLINWTNILGFTTGNYIDTNASSTAPNWWLSVCGADTCTYSGSGNWEIDMADNCLINTNYNVTGNISFTGASGNCTFNSSINATNLGNPPSNTILWIFLNAFANLFGGT